MPTDQLFETYEDRLLRVLTHIYANIEGDLNLDALADVACMSRYHWHRVFKAMTGETMAEAVRRLRLLKAANILVQDDMPVAEVAKRVGYPNLSSFSRAFSAAHGMSPNAFRENGAAIVDLLNRTPGEKAVYPVKIENQAAFRAAGVTHIGPYSEIGQSFQKLIGILMARSLLPHISGMFAVYHDAPDSKPENELRSQVAVMTTPTFPKELDGLDDFEVDAGKVAVLEHEGPYATLAAAYNWIYGTWLPQSGEEPRDAPPLEIYVNDPSTTPAAQLRTDIRIPLK